MNIDEIHALLSGIAALVILACIVAVCVRNRFFKVKGIKIYIALLLTFVAGNVLYIVQCLSENPWISLFAFRCQIVFTLLTIACLIVFFRNDGQLVLFKDITEQNRASQRLEYLSVYDGVTGLINADTFLKTMDMHYEKSIDGLCGTYVFAVSLGNADLLMGIASRYQKNELCKLIAKYILALLPKRFILSRFGENEFYIFSNGEEVDILNFIDLFEHTKHAIFTVEGQTFGADFNMGIYGANSPSITPIEAVDNVSFALSGGLTRGQSVEVYDFNMAQQHELHKKLITSLNDIDYQHDFYLEFQPIVDIQNNRVVGAEALLRWTHPIYGNLSPGVFIPIFESANEMSKLGHIILEKACDALNGWQNRLSENFKLSINISKKQIDDPALLQSIIKIVKRKNINPKQLDFEITETATTSRLDNVIDFCHGIKTMGASVSLDDFGSGDTSIAYITDFELDKVKLDISLSDKSHINQQRGIVVKSILNMCTRLNIQVVVEHVETIDALESLQSEGFSLIQGYIFSRPLPKDRFLAFYENFDIRTPCARR